MDNQKYQNNKVAKLFHIIQSCFFIMCFILFNHLYIQYIQENKIEIISGEEFADRNLIILLILLDLFVLCFFIFSLKRLRHMNNPTAEKIFAILFYWFTPLITFCIVECLTGNIKNFTFEYYLKNLVIYYLIYYLLLLILRNLKIVTLGYMTIFVVLGLVYYFVLLFRGRPFMIQDIFSVSTAMTVAGTYHYELPAKEFVVCMLYLCLCTLLFSINTNKYKFPKTLKTLISNIGVVGVFLFTLTYYNGILSPIDQWDLQLNYSQMGIVVTLFSEIPYLKTDKPHNYNPKSINEIANNIALSDDDKKTTIPQNIILIMNESFADLEYINKIDTDTELLPYWKSLRKNTISGYLNMPVFGAGTANSEYEVLSGNSIQFLSPGVAAYQMCVKENASSLVSLLKKQDFHTLAFHPFIAKNWNRNNVYKYLGFEQFYSAENCWLNCWLENTQYLRFYLSDTGTYEELIKKYEESNTNLFEFCVTMQNHGGYDDANYISTVRLNYDKDYPAAEQYLSILQESDLAFHHLIDYFLNESDNTMIVMFGDHQPPIETEFYEKLYGKALNELSFEESQLLYVTPFVIWTNYDIDEQTNVRMSSNYFGSYILQTAGLDMSAYNRFLLSIYEEIPIIGNGGICDKYGTWYTWDEMPEQYQNLINEYKIIQYNNVYDSKHRLNSFFEVE